MHIHPALLIVWAVLAAALIAVLIYRATLTQHETDQLFLNDDGTCCASHEEHDRIVARVEKLRPVCQGLTGITVAMTVLIGGMYIAQVISHI